MNRRAADEDPPHDDDDDDARAEPPDWISLLEAVASAMSHHLSNPLATISGSLDAFGAFVEADGDGRKEEVAAPLADARDAFQRLDGFVRALVDPARRDRAPRSADVQELLERASRPLREQGLRVDVRFADSASTLDVAVDEALVEVFERVIARAFECSLDPSEGLVVSAAHDDRVGLTVEFRAASTPPAALFRPGADEDAVLGGLGLLRAKRVVDDLGGRLVIDRTGVTLSIIVPARRAPPVVPARPPSVLVVDDDPFVRRTMQRALTMCSSQIVTHERARDALTEILAGARYDVIVCDLMMTDMNGIDLHRELLAAVPGQAARMIFVTGGAFTAQGRAFLAATRRPVLAKPFGIAELRAAVLRTAGAG
jgi:CheY-like chemotaxis protein